MHKSDSLHIHFKPRAKASGKFTIAIFQDHEHTVAYVPSLKLSAYGDNETEAIKMLIEEVLNDFFENITALSPEAGWRELEKSGWKKKRYFNKQFVSDSYVDKAGVLKNFNLPEETEIDTRVVSV